jgi:glycosyltransferase involved in cell wall biosynthesis
MTAKNDGEMSDGPHTLRLANVRIAVDARNLRHPGMGIHGYLDAGVKLLIREGADVVLLTNFSNDDLVNEYPGARWESFGSRRDIIWDQIDLPRFLRTHDFQYYWAPGNNGIPIRGTGRTTTVCTTHDVIPLRLPRMYLLRNPRFALPYIVWTFSGIVRSDVLLTVSESSARDIHKIFRRRSTIIPPSFSLESDVVGATALPEQLQGLEYIVYAGGMDPRKNVRNLLAAFAMNLRQSPALRLVIIGHSTETLAPDLAEHNLQDSVILTGFVSEQVKTAILKGARALVYPSIYEGFGLPILEAFAVDVPVITCRNSSLVEVAGDAAVYVNPLSPESIAQGIAEILQPDVADRRRPLGRIRLQHFDPGAAQQKLIDVFADVTSSKG